ncbi:MAG TPA: hypothetical protein VMU45_00425 [Candidatus Eisenbacteria bacterium]|nr:hypothetical protein [Candidatus Eisenbacteria bacterium]
MNYHDEFDDILDRALSEYRDAEPLAGIESRILARIDGREITPRKLGLRWAIALASAAAVALAVWLGVARHTPQTAAPSVTATARPVPSASAQPPAVAVAVSAAHGGKTPKSARQTASAAAPSAQSAQAVPAVFPLPTPLTVEERAFMTALQSAPRAEYTASDADSAITIARIEIKPLQVGGSVSGGEQ